MESIFINTNHCKTSERSIIIMLRFSSPSSFTIEQFCDDAQDILYDRIGATGHFRAAPKEESNLTEDFIVGYGEGAKLKAYYPRQDNEFFAAFYIEEIDADVPLSEELTIFPAELRQFCDTSGYSVEQVNIKEMY